MEVTVEIRDFLNLDARLQAARPKTPYQELPSPKSMQAVSLLRQFTLSDFFFPLIHQWPIDRASAEVGHV